MAKVHPSMRLKLKKGTFFMPESNGNVYFRNNSGSFRMEGRTIHQWVEKLIPVLNGEYSLASLTDGLPEPYMERVYEITNALYTNGFLRDVSKDRAHELDPQVVETFASQIEFLESFGDSAGWRFQQYRQQRVLAIGKGTMFLGLVSALLRSGMARFHAYMTDAENTSLERIRELENAARETDPDVSIKLVGKRDQPVSWFEQVDAFDAILYVSEESNFDELRSILDACIEKRKLFIPAICEGSTGLAGPIMSPDSDNCWTSAWRSVHHKEEKDNPHTEAFSSTAGAILSNVIVFEFFKKITEIKEIHHTNHMYLLDLETLEGKWSPYKRHPLVTGKVTAEILDDPAEELRKKVVQRDRNELLYYFSELSTSQLGIFHHWEEGDLTQLPLSQCGIQVVDVKSKELYPSIICAAMTHEEARREAGLTGVEHYVKPLKTEISASLTLPDDQPAPLHIGAGETLMEGIGRALQKTIEDEWKKQAPQCEKAITQLQLNKIEDNRCNYYLQCLKTMNLEPELGLGENAYGFPVVWMKVQDRPWYGCIGFNRILALRKALHLALMQTQNKDISVPFHVPSFSNISFEDGAVQSVDIPAYDSQDQPEVLQSVIHRLEQYFKQICFVKVELDPFKQDGMIDIYGVVFGEGGGI
jgi:putative thiazole-containing bacteriocin maturation protein